MRGAYLYACLGLTPLLLQYWKAVENASLLPDLQVLADGDLTEVRRAQRMAHSNTNSEADR